MSIESGRQSGIERRTTRRFACHWPAVCWRDANTSDPVVVIDASTSGFCVLSTISVEAGQLVVLALDSIGKFQCEVRWTAPDRFGVLIQQTAQELTASDVDDLAQRLDLAGSMA